METAQAYLQLIREDPYLSPMLASYDLAARHTCGRQVLDLGCGYGWGSYILSPHCLTVTGFDPDLERIRFARQTFHAENAQYHWDIRSLAGHTYDVVCLFMVLPHASDPAGLLRQEAPCGSASALTADEDGSACRTLRAPEAGSFRSS